MQFILAATPAEAPEAAKYCRTLAHVAYRIGPDSTLLRQNSLRGRSGFLSVSDREAPHIEHPEALCAAVMRECGRRGFSGAVLDFEEAPRQDRLAFVRLLENHMQKEHRRIFLPESYAAAAQKSSVLICTALSGGNITQRLRDARTAGCTALDVQRLRMDFSLPASSGEGTPLSGEELQKLISQEQPAVFFSPDLCARYFTYARDGRVHFVLFDDAETLNRKVRIGASLGFSTALFMWPEVKDIVDSLTLK